ncbi:MAG TPA: sensor histidine kinase [Solirubrobacteraceae bacterium]|nr:sensor histidine kinase [Solirubrobacteraceae bacterium]
MSTEIAASESQRRALEHAEAVAGRGAADAGGPFSRMLAGIGVQWTSLPLPLRLGVLATAGALAATAVGLLTSENPTALPSGLAVEIRVVMIVTLVAAGVYAQTSKIQARMGGLLIAVGLLSSLWLLNGSSNRVAFSVGVVFTGLMPLVFAYLILAHPTGHLPSRTELRFLWLTGGALAVLWLLGVAMTLQPPLRTPLLQCGPHCPNNVFSVGSATGAVWAVQAAMVIAWLAVTCGTPVLLARRARAASAPVRRSLTPVWITAGAAAVLLTASMLFHAAGLHVWATLGTIYVGLVAVLPLAILVGLGNERLFMGQALAEFVSELARMPAADPEALMAAALRDPSLKVAYRRPGRGTYVDAAGAAVHDLPDDAAITWVERDHQPLAAVMYSEDLSGYEPFVQAAGAAALMRLEKTQAEAELKASTADLASSRIRLMEMAHAERRRLERDLHDGVQQHLVGLRIKLDMAAETIKEDPERGERALASVGRQMDDVLQELRLLARGIYPSLLHECGLREALSSAARSSPLAVSVRAPGIARYPEEIEVAVYFCCLEAIQNVVKHAGPDATAMVTLSRDGPYLCFEVHDTGVGFESDGDGSGSGLMNMRDRIEAVGGVVEVTGRRGRGTSVRGRVPVG